ncbi:hypothetical protein ARMSODRAFT_960991 [Armillaria solidipes]|uniref:Uncharacterized protein n=1 Tax=Armillaria solidipes TaxID=1076256 RepID=A0A2H3B3Y9_9AGAR|nr:hypothetical protein ARMSODRAFT_960991 [Armillaria solidipes]
MGNASSRCRFGRRVAETAHHLFVSCPMFAALRSSYVARALTALQDLIDDHISYSSSPGLLLTSTNCLCLIHG